MNGQPQFNFENQPVPPGMRRDRRGKLRPFRPKAVNGPFAQAAMKGEQERLAALAAQQPAAQNNDMDIDGGRKRRRKTKKGKKTRRSTRRHR